MNIRRVLVGSVAISALLLVLGMAPPAAAEPATTPVYPGGASATRLSGYAFDTCEAPTIATMQAWTASPYRGVGVYIGGPKDLPPKQSQQILGVAGLDPGLAPDPHLYGSAGTVHLPRQRGRVHLC